VHSVKGNFVGKYPGLLGPARTEVQVQQNNGLWRVVPSRPRDRKNRENGARSFSGQSRKGCFQDAGCLFGEFGYVPAAAKGADQGYAVDELAGLEVDGGALILYERGFGGEDFKIAGDAAFVALA